MAAKAKRNVSMASKRPSPSTPQSELILDVADMTASGGDGQHLLPAIQRVEEHIGVTVERVIGDGA